jgi:hypothetical protein
VLVQLAVLLQFQNRTVLCCGAAATAVPGAACRPGKVDQIVPITAHVALCYRVAPILNDETQQAMEAALVDARDSAEDHVNTMESRNANKTPPVRTKALVSRGEGQARCGSMVAVDSQQGASWAAGDLALIRYPTL